MMNRYLCSAKHAPRQQPVGFGCHIFSVLKKTATERERELGSMYYEGAETR